MTTLTHQWKSQLLKMERGECRDCKLPAVPGSKRCLFHTLKARRWNRDHYRLKVGIPLDRPTRPRRSAVVLALTLFLGSVVPPAGGALTNQVCIIVPGRFQGAGAEAPFTHDELRWKALSQVESGDCDTCVGPRGEVGRWQCSPSVWRSVTRLPTTSARNWAIALNVAEAVMASRTHGKPVDDRRFFLLWHCPAHAGRPDAEERDYAQRCLNLLQALEK